MDVLRHRMGSAIDLRFDLIGVVSVLGDQYGTLMAGAWSLLSDVVTTQEEAEQCIACHDWESYSQSTELSDEQRALALDGDLLLEGKLVRVPPPPSRCLRLMRRDDVDASEALLPPVISSFSGFEYQQMADVISDPQIGRAHV